VVYKTVTADVEVDLGDFEIDDLIEVIEEEGYVVTGPFLGNHRPNDVQEEMIKIWEAMYLGKPYDAMVRKFISDQTGRFL
jgi:hypothetical protein